MTKKITRKLLLSLVILIVLMLARRIDLLVNPIDAKVFPLIAWISGLVIIIITTSVIVAIYAFIRFWIKWLKE